MSWVASLGRSPGNGPPTIAAMNAKAVQDWLQIRRQLLDMEAAFTRLAIRVADGKESEAVLREQRELLEAQRALCTAAYERAFPAAANA